MKDIERLVWSNKRALYYFKLGALDAFRRLSASKRAEAEREINATGATRCLTEEVSATVITRQIDCSSAADRARATRNNVIALLRDCRDWQTSPRRSEIIAELERLERQFTSDRSAREDWRLADETIATILDSGAGGPGFLVQGEVVNGNFLAFPHEDRRDALLTDRDENNALLFDRMLASSERRARIAAVAVRPETMFGRARLRELFEREGAPGRGSLLAFREQSHLEDRRLVARAASRAVKNLKAAFQMQDMVRDHQRGGTIENWLSPAPIMRFITSIAAQVAPFETCQRIRDPDHDRTNEKSPTEAEIDYLIHEGRALAKRIGKNAVECRAINLFCGVQIYRITNDTRSDRSISKETKALERLTERVVLAHDDIILLQAWSNTLNYYTDRLYDKAPRGLTEEVEYLKMVERVVCGLCKPARQWYHEARTNWRDGVIYAEDVRPRATGISGLRRSLPKILRESPTCLINTYSYGFVACPVSRVTWHAIVATAMGADAETIQAWQTFQKENSIDDFFEQLRRIQP